MTDDTPPPSKWRNLAGEASRWTFKNAKAAGAKGLELARAAEQKAREEIKSQRQQAEAAAERRRQNAADSLAEAEEQERLAAEKEQHEKEEAAAKALERAIEREPQIRAFYADRMNMAGEEIPYYESGFIEYGQFIDGQRSSREEKFELAVKLIRPLSSMTNQEITILLYNDLFHNYGFYSDDVVREMVSWPIVFNAGNCNAITSKYYVSSKYEEKFKINSTNDAVLHRFQKTGFGEKSDVGINNLFLVFSARIDKGFPDHPIVREFRNMLIGGSNWLTDQDVPSSIFSFMEFPKGLFLGATESGRDLWYEGEGSLITIAPPGSGKTQCHVFPNVLNSDSPMVILDVKGECFEKTSNWRKLYVGPVFKFNPLNPAESARYNPLALLVDDPETLWEESRLLADLLIVPEDKQNPTWENRARDVVTGAIAWLVHYSAPQDRRMSKILDVVNMVEWQTFLKEAGDNTEIPALSRLAISLAGLPERQLEGVLDAARRQLSVWEGTRVDRVTSTCDWTPEVLRDGSNSTIYICIPPNEIESYAPLLRVIFAQHLRELLRKLPAREQNPILFMLDELPRLGPMRPVEEALEVGRQYGIRLWLFVQSLGQLEQTYRNASGMIGSCAVRCYMNPSGHDGTAKRLSEELGFVESIIDGSRKPLVEVSDLTGPEYADKQIVIGRNTRPVKLRKSFAHANPKLVKRMNTGDRLFN